MKFMKSERKNEIGNTKLDFKSLPNSANLTAVKTARMKIRVKLHPLAPSTGIAEQAKR